MVQNIRLRLAHWVAKLFDTRLPYFKGARQLRNGLASFLVPTLHPPQIISTRYGFDIRVSTAHDSIDSSLYAYGTYEAGTLNIISKCLNEGDVFIDIGANIGLMTLVSASRVGDSGAVYAFEPMPDTFNLLQSNISLNKMKNIHPINAGLGSAQGIEVIYSTRPDNRGMASFVNRDTSVVEGTEVPVGTLDAFLTEQGVSTVRMMKIDVEGWELEVLQGAQILLSGPESPILCVEYNTQLPEYKAVYDLITSSNTYQVYVLPHGNWHTSRLIEVQSVDDLPAIGSINIYCFLPGHLRSIPPNLFM